MSKAGFQLKNVAIPVGRDWQAIQSLSVYRFRHHLPLCLANSPRSFCGSELRQGYVSIKSCHFANIHNTGNGKRVKLIAKLHRHIEKSLISAAVKIAGQVDLCRTKVRLARLCFQMLKTSRRSPRFAGGKDVKAVMPDMIGHPNKVGKQ